MGNKNRTYKNSKTTERIFNALEEVCCGDYGASAMMASLYSISKLSPKYLGMGISVDKTALGLGGWIGTNKRKVCAMAAESGKSNTNLDIQLEFLTTSLVGNAKLMDAFASARTVEEAVIAALRFYEKKRVKDIDDATKNERMGVANYYMKLYGRNVKEIDDDPNKNIGEEGNTKHLKDSKETANGIREIEMEN